MNATPKEISIIEEILKVPSNSSERNATLICQVSDEEGKLSEYFYRSRTWVTEKSGATEMQQQQAVRAAQELRPLGEEQKCTPGATYAPSF